MIVAGYYLNGGVDKRRVPCLAVRSLLLQKLLFRDWLVFCWPIPTFTTWFNILKLVFHADIESRKCSCNSLLALLQPNVFRFGCYLKYLWGYDSDLSDFNTLF